MTELELSTIEQSRRDYAHWYVREQLARKKADTISDGRGGLMQMKLLGIDPEELFGFDLAGTAEDLSRIAEWLVAEAEWHRLHAEAVLRSYGIAVL